MPDPLSDAALDYAEAWPWDVSQDAVLALVAEVRRLRKLLRDIQECVTPAATMTERAVQILVEDALDGKG